MKKITTLLLMVVLSITINSCTKSEDSNTSSSGVSSPFTVKYEITSTSNVIASYGLPMVAYVNSTGQKQTESVPNLSPSTPWSKTVTVTTPTRPLQLSLLLSSSPPNAYRLFLPKAGDVIQNLYLNGVLVASSTNKSENSPTSGAGEYNVAIIALDYSVK